MRIQPTTGGSPPTPRFGRWSKPPTAWKPTLAECFQPPPSFSPKDLVYIQSQLTRCRYGWAWPWLSRALKTSFVPDESGVTIANRRPNRKLRGDCKELSIQLSRKLFEHFRGKYRFYVMGGNFEDSPWLLHFYVLAWPSAQDEDFRQTLQRQRGELPNGALIIDPALGRMGIRGAEKSDPSFSTYSTVVDQGDLRQGHDMVSMKPVTLPFSSRGGTAFLPLGELSRLDPALKKPDQDFALIGFTRLPEKPFPQVLLGLGSACSDQVKVELIKNWHERLKQGTPLFKVLSRVHQGLQQAAANANQYVSNAMAKPKRSFFGFENWFCGLQSG